MRSIRTNPRQAAMDKFRSGGVDKPAGTSRTGPAGGGK